MGYILFYTSVCSSLVITYDKKYHEESASINCFSNKISKMFTAKAFSGAYFAIENEEDRIKYQVENRKKSHLHRGIEQQRKDRKSILHIIIQNSIPLINI